MIVTNDQDYKWSSRLKNVLLHTYTTAEMESLRTRFISENKPTQDGAFAYSEGYIHTWSHLAKKWVQVSGDNGSTHKNPVCTYLPDDHIHSIAYDDGHTVTAVYDANMNFILWATN